LANELAEIDGATAAPRPEPDPESVGWIEPDTCPRCGMEVRLMPTNYDRWVHLGMAPMRAKEVPRRYRWRIGKLSARHSPHPTAFIAVRVSGLDPLPDDLLMPAHAVECEHPTTMAEVQQARQADIDRRDWLPPSVEEFEDSEDP